MEQRTIYLVLAKLRCLFHITPNIWTLNDDVFKDFLLTPFIERGTDELARFGRKRSRSILMYIHEDITKTFTLGSWLPSRHRTWDLYNTKEC
jgi:hypothetical protein